jgi:hypothetical protein
MIDNCSIILLTCDKYLPVAKLCVARMRQFDLDRYINIRLCNMGVIAPSWGIDTINCDDLSYSDGLLHFLSFVETKYVITWVEDRLLARRPNYMQLNQIINIMSTKEVDFIKLISGNPCGRSYHKDKLTKISQNQRYPISFSVSMWKTSFLRSHLMPGWSPWDIERKMPGLLNEPLLYSFSGLTGNRPFDDQHLIIRGKHNRRISCGGLSSYMSKNGFSRQPFSDYIKESVHKYIVYWQDRFLESSIK